MPVVLVVDDSEVDRRLVGGLLPKELDWLVEFAENGEQALEKMAESVPDVVITDMMMPVMDGMELVTNIHVDFPNVPVILITGHGNEALAVEALNRARRVTFQNLNCLRSSSKPSSRFWHCHERTAAMFV